jgi:iron complex transport system permease protein
MKGVVTHRALAGGGLLLLALLGLIAAALTHGQISLTLGQAIRAVIDPAADPVASQIVAQIRMPRMLTGVLAGAGLGVAGVLMQALFRNPVADAWSLGLTAGGQLGVALAVAGAAFAGPAAVSFVSTFKGLDLTLGAAIGVSAAAALVLSLGRRLGTITLLVVGLMIWFTAQGLVSVILHFASRAGGRVFGGWNDGWRSRF